MRRTGVALAAAAGAVGTRARADAAPAAGLARDRATFVLFSKPLPELGWDALGHAVKSAGYDGIDLTVRPKGHVLPQRVAEDLPRALEAIRAHGLTVPMITTDLTSADAPHARPLLQTAARHGVRFFKTGYWQYRSPDVRGEVAAAGRALTGLAALAREYGIQLGFHNHAAYVGAALWDIAPAMDRLDRQSAGYYFDPRHAVAEGGSGAWKTAMHLVLPRLKMLAVKDFAWVRDATSWRAENRPLGEGMVDWAWVGSTLRDARFAGPISIHLEYEIAAASVGDRTAHTLEAAAKDLEFAKGVLA
jgi:sugar phosphate isomerase/epimerase